MACPRSCLLKVIIPVVSILLFGCDTGTSTNGDGDAESISLSSQVVFPFEDFSNWWMYTEEGGNSLKIEVVDTISDDGNLYYKISFMEESKDTTSDWFRRNSEGIYYSKSIGMGYEMFLPLNFTKTSGTYLSGTQDVYYSFMDSMDIGGTVHDSILKLSYSEGFLHGFDEIILASDLGIVSMTDSSGRIPFEYRLDSCSVSGEVKRY